MVSLRTKLLAGLAVILLYGFWIIQLALSLPASELQFSLQGDQLLAAGPDAAPRPVESMLVGGKALPARAVLVIEEPDVLPVYSDINQFFAEHTQLLQALKAGTLQVRYQDGSEQPLHPLPRGLMQLPGMFWLQLLCGLAGMVICMLVWVPGEHNLATRSFALSGLGYLLASSTAAVYSTRELFIDGELFRILSGLNHCGAMLFSAAVSAFLWSYPRRAPSVWIPLALYGGFASCMILDQLQLTASPVEGFHLWVIGVFMIGLSGAVWQWRQTRNSPADRSAFRWVLLSILAGTVFFSAGMILPVILQVALPHAQGPLLATFLLMYTGMALGITRYRLFELERWWFSIWSWLLGGLAVLLTDLALASLLTLSGPTVLAASVALVGWVYFPVRQFIWGRLTVSRQRGLDTWLSQALPVMLQAQRSGHTDSAMEQALLAVFQPLRVERLSHKAQRPQVVDNGDALQVPGPSGEEDYLLRHAEQGRRLFTRQDVQLARLVLSLDSLVLHSLTARVEGATEERNRIRQDIHDDLGAKLLQLLHTASDDSRQLVREAIRDLRELLQSMDGHEVRLDVAAARWQEETASRCQASDVTLHWQQTLGEQLLSAGQFSHLTRVLREAVSNALRHATPTELRVELSQQGGAMLQLRIENDGVALAETATSGRGLQIMLARARQLGGELQHGCAQQRWWLALQVPIAPSDTPAAD
ncbi:sensor histidine kinase [Halopseudomonas pachastrellae]|uniref:histidine kinase n=1 Tax=Halopseudomonas pachastrellae TaxID=254161 RepID=A0A1S8DKJ9_9GAMM|nr:ATP-binding protein [Halopseudomonas pachastrellae]ONM45336.1 sensor histidine kinase [Halopseudomonas pachastrellae]SFL74825.1 hypothetical protein SAMN05216256_101236 [Halopseudomonas pachastrellae]